MKNNFNFLVPNINRSFLFLGLAFVFTTKVFAYNSIINTGNVTESGSYKLGSELQFLTDDPSGANVLIFVDLPTKSQSLDYRLKFGTGTTDINMGVAAKWMPIPDLQKQPAMGILFDFDWISDEDLDLTTFRVAPLISKKFGWEYGSMTPYAAIPLGGRYLLDSPTDDDFDFFVQLTFGVELNFEAYQNLTFFGEAGFDIEDSINYFSFAARYKM